MPRMIGDIVCLESDFALVRFVPNGQTARVNISEFKHLEDCLLQGMRIAFTPETKTLEVPIVSWIEKNKIKFLSYLQHDDNNV